MDKDKLINLVMDARNDLNWKCQDVGWDQILKVLPKDNYDQALRKLQIAIDLLLKSN